MRPPLRSFSISKLSSAPSSPGSFFMKRRAAASYGALWRSSPEASCWRGLPTKSSKADRWACCAWQRRVCAGASITISRKISAGDAGLIAGVKGAVAGSTNTLLAVGLGAAWPGGKILSGILVLGLLGYGVSLVLFIVSLRQLGTARTGAYFSTAPFIGSALSVVLYGEPITALFYVAAVLMAAGVWLHVTEQHEHAHWHATPLVTIPNPACAITCVSTDLVAARPPTSGTATPPTSSYAPLPQGSPPEHREGFFVTALVTAMGISGDRRGQNCFLNP